MFHLNWFGAFITHVVILFASQQLNLEWISVGCHLFWVGLGWIDVYWLGCISLVDLNLLGLS